MDILIALALLIWLVSRGGKRRTTAPEKPAADELDWIDDLELLDAATDDFI